MKVKYYLMDMDNYVNNNVTICRKEFTEEEFLEFEKSCLYPKYKVWRIETHIINGYWKPSGHKEPECHVYIYI